MPTASTRDVWPAPGCAPRRLRPALEARRTPQLPCVLGACRPPTSHARAQRLCFVRPAPVRKGARRAAPTPAVGSTPRASDTRVARGRQAQLCKAHVQAPARVGQAHGREQGPGDQARRLSGAP